jgi:hypothetical protein
MHETTGHSREKLDADMARPLYMQPADAVEYGIVDKIMKPREQMTGTVLSASQWDKAAGLVAREVPRSAQ